MQQYRKTNITTEIHQDAMKCEVEPPQPFMKPPCIYVWLSYVLKCLLVKIQTTSDGLKKYIVLSYWCFIVKWVTNAISCSNKLKHTLLQVQFSSQGNYMIQLPKHTSRTTDITSQKPLIALLPTVLHLNSPWRHGVFNSHCFHSTQPLLATQFVWAEICKGERKRERGEG